MPAARGDAPAPPTPSTTACPTVDPNDRLVLAGPQGVFVDVPGGSPVSILPFGAGDVPEVTDCRFDGADHLVLAGVARAGLTLGDKVLGGPMRKRPKTAWIEPSPVGFVARLAL